MRSKTRPPLMRSTIGLSFSRAVLMALAPIASRTSMIKWITRKGTDGGIIDHSNLQITRTAAQFFQQRIAHIGCGKQCFAFRFQRFFGFIKIGNIQNLHLADHFGCVGGGVKPPPARASLAIKEAAATTDGSSMTIGTRTSRPLTRKFRAMPKRKRVNTDHILDHLVSLRFVQPCPAAELCQFIRRQTGFIGDLLKAFVNAQFVKLNRFFYPVLHCSAADNTLAPLPKTIRNLQAVMIAWFEQRHLSRSFGCHAFCPGFCVLFDQIESAVMHGHDNARVKQLDRAQGVIRTHGVIIADGQRGKIEPFLADQAHIPKQAGITREIQALAVIGGDQKSGTDCRRKSHPAGKSRAGHWSA